MARDDHRHHRAQVPSRRLHNPFPPEPKGLTFLEGHLHFDPEVLPSQRFKAGKHFTVSWDTTNGVLSVSHRSEPDRVLWATPSRGSSFLSAALGESTIHESRGSYSLHDKVDLLCTHQTIQDICVTRAHKVVKQTPTNAINTSPSPTAHVAVDADGTALEGDDGDVVVVSGCLYSDCETASEELRRHNCGELAQLDNDDDDGDECGSPFERMSYLRWFGFGAGSRGESFGVRYRLVFSGKRDHQLGFHVELDDPVKKKKMMMNVEGYHSRRFAHEPPEELWLWSKEPRSAFRGGLADQSINYNKRWSDKLVTFRRQTLKKSYNSSVHEVLGSLTLEGDDDDDDVVPRLNRVLLTYMSHPDERFFGFGEQFSCFDMKGKRVPIMVQEQGLGRGDQPITAAANLVAYRYQMNGRHSQP